MAAFKGQIRPSPKHPVKLDLRDKKIIQYYITNPRVSLSQIAKDLHIHKSSVARRIQSLYQKGIFVEPILITDFSNFGIQRINISFILKKPPSQQTIETLCKLPFMVSVASAMGKFQLLVFFDKIPTKSLEKYTKKIKSIVGPVESAEICNIGRLEMNPYNLYGVKIEYEYSKSKSKIKLKPIDVKIIKHLHSNPLMRSTTLAEKIGENQKTVFNRIKVLMQNEIIRPFHNISVFDMGFTAFFIFIKCDKEIAKKINTFVFTNRFLNNTHKREDGIGMVATFDSFANLYDFTAQIDKKFSKQIDSIDHMVFTDQHINDFLPKEVLRYLEKTIT